MRIERGSINPKMRKGKGTVLFYGKRGIGVDSDFGRELVNGGSMYIERVGMELCYMNSVKYIKVEVVGVLSWNELDVDLGFFSTI